MGFLRDRDDPGNNGWDKTSCGTTRKALAQVSPKQQRPHVGFFEAINGPQLDFTRNQVRSDTVPTPTPRSARTPRRLAPLGLEAGTALSEVAAPGGERSQRGDGAAPSGKQSKGSGSRRGSDKPANDQVNVQRLHEACEALRMIFFGRVGNEDWPIMERSKIFEQKRGTDAEIEVFLDQWMSLDEDDSGHVEFHEFLDYFVKKKADKLVGMRCWRYLVSRPGDKQVRRRDLLRLIWLGADQDDIEAMDSLAMLKTLQRAAVKPIPLLPKRRRKELFETFCDLDTAGRGVIPYTDLVLVGLADEAMIRELREKYDKDGDGTLDFEEFLDMLCPYGYRAHNKVTAAIAKNGQAMYLATCMCGEHKFQGWFWEATFQQLKTKHSFDEAG